MKFQGFRFKGLGDCGLSGFRERKAGWRRLAVQDLGFSLCGLGCLAAFEGSVFWDVEEIGVFRALVLGC